MGAGETAILTEGPFHPVIGRKLVRHSPKVEQSDQMFDGEPAPGKAIELHRGLDKMLTSPCQQARNALDSSS
jgi:hypothetical protein